MSNAPCMNCLNRSVTCHGTCDAYKSFRNLKDIEREKRLEHSERIYAVSSYIYSKHVNAR